jgi:hypothetical protein
MTSKPNLKEKSREIRKYIDQNGRSMNTQQNPPANRN